MFSSVLGTKRPKKWCLFVLTLLTLDFFCNNSNGEFMWTEKKYFEQGFPQITKEVYQLLLQERFSFIPNYTVLENECHEEDNVHLMVKEITGTLFRLYGQQHPDYPNYKIAIFNHTTEMHKCRDSKSCEKLLVCENATIQFHENERSGQEDVVYISWKKSSETSVLSILAQYKDKITKCRDFNHSFKIKKFVMNSIQRQTVSSTRVSFFVEHNVNNINKKKGPFSLNENDIVYVQVLQCSDCKMTVKLECQKEEMSRVTILAENGTKVVNFQQFLLYDSWYYGWRGFYLHNLSNKNQTECYLNINLNTYDSRSTEVETFWAIGYGTANLTKSAITSTSSTITYTDSTETVTEEQTTKKQQSTTPSPSSSPNSGKRCSQLPVILSIIEAAALILLLCLLVYLLFKFRRLRKRNILINLDPSDNDST